MIEAAAHVSWGLAAIVAAMVLAGLALRRWGGRTGLTVGAVLAWGACALAALWAASALLAAFRLAAG